MKSNKLKSRVPKKTGRATIDWEKMNTRREAFLGELKRRKEVRSEKSRAAREGKLQDLQAKLEKKVNELKALNALSALSTVEQSTDSSSPKPRPPPIQDEMDKKMNPGEKRQYEEKQAIQKRQRVLRDISNSPQGQEIIPGLFLVDASSHLTSSGEAATLSHSGFHAMPALSPLPAETALSAPSPAQAQTAILPSPPSTNASVHPTSAVSTASIAEPTPGVGGAVSSDYLSGYRFVVGPTGSDNLSPTEAMLKKFGGEIGRNTSPLTDCYVIVGGITSKAYRRILKSSAKHKFRIILLDGLISVLNGTQTGGLDSLTHVESYRVFDIPPVAWTDDSADARNVESRWVLVAEDLKDEEREVIPLEDQNSHFSHPQLLNMYASRIANGGSMISYLVDLAEARLESADGLLFATFGRDKYGPYIQLKGVSKIGRTLKGGQLNKKEEDWSDAAYYRAVRDGIGAFNGVTIATPFGYGTDEMRVYHESLVPNNKAAVAAVKGGYDAKPTRHYGEVIVRRGERIAGFPHNPPQFIEFEGHLYRKKRIKTKGKVYFRYVCSQHHTCKAAITADQDGNLTQSRARAPHTCSNT